jgi:uncharacterized protein DUF4160
VTPPGQAARSSSYAWRAQPVSRASNNGILIRMYFGDHPPPHFHALYAGQKARVSIATGDVIDGELPPRAARLVRECASPHRTELEENWRRCERRVPLEQVEPLQ